MRRTLIVCTLALCALALSACFGQIEDKHPDKVLTKRVALFKQFTRALEPIGLVVAGRREYKPAEFAEMVQELQTLSTKPWPYFTADGNYPPTRARSAVWDEPAAFKAAQDKYVAAVNVLAAAGASSAGSSTAGASSAGASSASSSSAGASSAAADLSTIKAAAEAVGDACKACHKQFRYE